MFLSRFWTRAVAARLKADRHPTSRRSPADRRARLDLTMLEDRTTPATVDLFVTKAATPATAGPGETITYTIVAGNNGPGTATAATLTDNFPAGQFSSVTFTSTPSGGATGNTATGTGNLNQTLTLPSGSSVTYTVTATVANTATGPITNTANIAPGAADTDPITANNAATATTPVEADLQVTKTAASGTNAQGAQTITYTIVVSNPAGSGGITGATLTDTFPAGQFSSVTFTSTPSGGATGNTATGTGNINETNLNLPAGSSITYTAIGTLAPGATAPAANTATGAVNPANNADTNAANNSATATTTGVDLQVTKTSGSTVAGGTVTYTIVVSNAGPGTATGAVLSDTFPAQLTNVTFTSTPSGGATGNTNPSGPVTQINDTLNLPSGGSVTYTVTGTVAPNATGPIVNTARVTPGSGNFDTNTANNTATDSDPLGTTTTLTSSANPSTVGQAVTFTATVTSLGGANPTAGTVQFLSDGTVIGATDLAGDNVATFTTSSLGAGARSVTAQYLGTAGSAPSTSNTIIQQVDTPVVPPFPVPGPPALTRNLAVGGATNGTAHVFLPDAGAPLYTPAPAATVAPFGNTGTNLRTAAGDVNGDNVEDTIVVTGPGTAIRLAVISGVDNTTVLVPGFDPFSGGFTGGGFVASADFDGDGRDEIIATPDRGGGPRVVIFSLLPAGFVTRASFFGIADPEFRGGARAAAGRVNGDATPELVVAAGFGGGPRVALYDGNTAIAGTPTRLLGDFFVFEDVLRNGVYVAVGDVNADGFGDLIFGAGPGGGPRVLTVSGQRLLTQGAVASVAAPLGNFFVGNTDSDRGGVRVTAKDADGDNRAEVAVGTGDAQPARVRVYPGTTFVGSGEPAGFQDLSIPFAGVVLTDGVFVG